MSCNRSINLFKLQQYLYKDLMMAIFLFDYALLKVLHFSNHNEKTKVMQGERKVIAL